MKFTSKSEYLDATEQQWEMLWKLLDDRESIQRQPENSKQILGHLYAWHRLLIGWVRTGVDGQPDLPAKGYNWQQTRQLNAVIDAENSKLELSSIVRRLKLSHRQVVRIVEGLTEKQFFQSGYYNWTGKLGIASYIVPNTFSHYRWAIKKLKKLP